MLTVNSASSSGVSRSGRPSVSVNLIGLADHSARRSTAGKFSSLFGMIWSAGNRKPYWPVSRSS